MDATARGSHDVIAAAHALEIAYRELIDHWKAERSLLAHPSHATLENGREREDEILAAIATAESKLRKAGDELATMTAAAPVAAPRTLLVVAAGLADPAARQAVRDALISLRETVRTARTLGRAQAQFVEHGLASLQDALSRWASESRPVAGYGEALRRVPTAASGTFVRETA